MDTKEMRAALKDVVDVVPRNNEDVIALFKEKFPDVIQFSEPEIEEINEEVWTYVGSGHEPPQVTNFMGRQVFMRGHPVKVTDPVVLGKIQHHKCFVKGKVAGEKIIEMDEKEKNEFERKRLENERIQRNATLMYKG